eukprot:15296152-Alexandrium_andersonii.AAC.1
MVRARSGGPLTSRWARLATSGPMRLGSLTAPCLLRAGNVAGAAWGIEGRGRPSAVCRVLD